VVVATVRALKYHGGVAVADLEREDVAAVRAGGDNLRRHLQNLRDVFGIPAVVAINRFPHDTDAEVAAVCEVAGSEGCGAFASTHARDGGPGAVQLAHGLTTLLDKDEADVRMCYPDELGLVAKAEAVARRVYRATGVSWSARARRQLDRITADGHGHLPVCFAKTQYSFSTDPTARGAPEDHVVDVREVRLSAGAGFVVLVAGEVLTMPGLPAVPASVGMSIDAEGTIHGLS
jgi:formate--tetrahydrofolate ligase